MMRSKTSLDSRCGAAALAALAVLLAAPAQALDVCGCAGSPDSLGDWDSGTDPATWPFVTRSEYDENGDLQVVSRQISVSGNTITMPLPDDGVLIFDSFVLDGPGAPGDAALVFERNLAGTPVTLLVAGDFTVGGGDTIDLDGEDGQDSETNLPGLGGVGGPGGFKGGDGGYNLAATPTGGAGHGPGGGAPGPLSSPTFPNPNRAYGRGGSFVGSADLLPLNGGSGGGGATSDSGSTSGANPGGGGGGGAILVAADAALTVNGTIRARGGDGGNCANTSEGIGAGAGSGGAIRLVASSIAGNGTLTALRGGVRCNAGNTAGNGRIRLESLGSSFPANNAFPFAVVVNAPGPVVLPFTPTVRIAAIEGTELTTPPPLGGWRKTSDPNKIDVILSAPGPTTVEIDTRGVPFGTTVRVSAVPYVGANKTTQDVTIDSCFGNGVDCTASATFDLAAGGYVIEARATFQTP